jgi:hypothetical protein
VYNIHRENERSRLKLALDRQARADRSEDWMVDQHVIDNALDRLAIAGCDRDKELQDAIGVVNSWHSNLKD